MKRAQEFKMISDLYNYIKEIQFRARRFIEEDDMDGLERTLLDVSEYTDRFIVFITYLFQNCKPHQAQRIAYYAREFSTHTYCYSTQFLFVEEFLMWKELGETKCLLGLLQRLEIAKKNGRVNADFNLVDYLGYYN